MGATYLFKIEAYNPNGSSFSEAVGFVFASIPATPTQAPTQNLAKTTAANLPIQVETVTDDGQSPILSYNVEIDDGHGREFSELYGG